MSLVWIYIIDKVLIHVSKRGGLNLRCELIGVKRCHLLTESDVLGGFCWTLKIAESQKVAAFLAPIHIRGEFSSGIAEQSQSEGKGVGCQSP